MEKIYLDYNATSPVKAEVLDAMLPYLREQFGNPSSVHWAGRAANAAVERAREEVAALMGGNPAEIIFTSCGSEGNNLALKGVAQATDGGKNHLITSSVEHPSVLEPCRFLERAGWNISYLPVDDQGRLALDRLEAAIRPETALISIMAANNETGNLYPLEEIAEIAGRNRILFHSDMVQAAGKIDLNVTRTGLDLAVISGHKFGAPKGVGAIYVKSGCNLEILIHGGHQERSRRAGTLNVAGIVGLGTACRLSKERQAEEVRRVRGLRDRLENGLRGSIPDVRLNGCEDQDLRLPNTVNLSFCGVEAESLLMNLDLKGIAAATGSACSSGSLDASHVIAAMGVDDLQARSSIRFSLGPESTEAQIDCLLSEMPPLVARLRSISPF